LQTAHATRRKAHASSQDKRAQAPGFRGDGPRSGTEETYPQEVTSHIGPAV
jgi:hypothetical protein